jgi:hypothetical protein
MTKIDVKISSEYGIMFLYDAKNKPNIPAGAGELPVTWTSTCLAFSVLTYVDGDAQIILCDSPSDQLRPEYFSGQIECPSKSISLCDHNGFAFASVPLKDLFAKVSLLMSEDRNPDIVSCVITNMETF